MRLLMPVTRFRWPLLVTAGLALCGAGPSPSPGIGGLSGTAPIVVTPSGAGSAARVISCPTCNSTSAAVTDNKCWAWDSTTAVTAQTVTFAIPWTSYTVTELQTSVAGGGSFTVGAQINGTNITSCSAVTVSGTSNTNTACTAANTGGVNDQISLVVSSPSGTVNTAYICPVFTHTPN